MKLIIVLLSLAVSATTSASQTLQETMPVECEMALSQHAEIKEGSVSSSPQDIVEGLKYDWAKNPSNPEASYDDCGSSDFYYVTVDKMTCSVTSSGGGDSDGEC